MSYYVYKAKARSFLKQDPANPFSPTIKLEAGMSHFVKGRYMLDARQEARFEIFEVEVKKQLGKDDVQKPAEKPKKKAAKKKEAPKKEEPKKPEQEETDDDVEEVTIK